jgi:AraC-like DNA-binding protein
MRVLVAAKAMLERGAAPIQTISCEVGYEDSALFKRATGMTPAEYRARFAEMDVRMRAEADARASLSLIAD